MARLGSHSQVIAPDLRSGVFPDTRVQICGKFPPPAPKKKIKMKNQLIVQIFNNIADILELKGIPWKPQAYRKVARVIETLPEDIREIYKKGKLTDLPGVGEHIGKKIEEIIKTGKLKYYQKLKKEVKINLEELSTIPSLGPKKIKILYKKLNIKNLKDLQQAIKKGKLKAIKGFGELTEKTLQEGIQFVKTNPKRFLYSQAQPIVEEIIKNLKKLKEVKRVEVAGSFRRGKETIGDLDFLAISNKPTKVIQAFTSLKDVKKVLAKGTTKSSILLNNNLQVDLRVVKEYEFGSAMNYFIGSKQHNVELRKYALKLGYTLSEYGLFKLKNRKRVAGKTEEEIYKKLKLQYIPPELRENTGEIEAAKQNKLPNLVTIKDIKGILHCHSNWTDGANTLLEMAKSVERKGFKFMSFNDHCGYIGITNPINEKRLKGYLKEINKVKKKVNIEVFSGLEIDIDKKGDLALPKECLKDLDLIIAAVHTAIKMPESDMTERVTKCLENYPVHILSHPTDRLINERPGLKIDLKKIFQTAKNNQVLMEINTQPKRLDLNGSNIKAAKEIGCKFAICPDAHSIEGLDNYTLGILMARRGWLEKKDILNCWNINKVKKFLK